MENAPKKSALPFIVTVGAAALLFGGGWFAWQSSRPANNPPVAKSPDPAPVTAKEPQAQPARTEKPTSAKTPETPPAGAPNAADKKPAAAVAVNQDTDAGELPLATLPFKRLVEFPERVTLNFARLPWERPEPVVVDQAELPWILYSGQ